MMTGGGIIAVVLFGALPSRRRWIGLFGLVLIASVITGVGCGGGSGTPVQKNQGTPAGTYVITITGTSGSLSHSTTVSFTVQ